MKEENRPDPEKPGPFEKDKISGSGKAADARPGPGEAGPPPSPVPDPSDPARSRIATSRKRALVASERPIRVDPATTPARPAGPPRVRRLATTWPGTASESTGPRDLVPQVEPSPRGELVFRPSADDDGFEQDWGELDEGRGEGPSPGGAESRPDSATLPAVLAPPDPDSLGQWIAVYYSVHVVGAPARTELAKRADLEVFVGFYVRATGHDRGDGWPPAVTKQFQAELRTTVSERTGRTYKATTVNRILATVRHFGRWLVRRRPLLAGHPFQGVRDIVIDPPAWKGLTPIEVLRLKAAGEQRLKACTRGNQNPLLELTVFTVLLHTGLRESELVSLDLNQYEARSLLDVPRKGKKLTPRVPVPPEAKDLLDLYIQESRGGELGPLLQNRYGRRLHPQDVGRICQRLANQANAHLPAAEHIHLTPHMLRHTFLKKVADKHGVHVAQRLSGNTSIREIFRYTKPSAEELQKTVDELYV